MSKYILAIDEGTTSERVILYDVIQKRIVASHSLPLNCYYPKNGWVEQDANQIWESVRISLQFLVNKKKLTTKNTFGICITNQREAVCSFNDNGDPLAPIISWQCKRTADFCENLEQTQKDNLKAKTGLILDSYFSASKIKWLLENNRTIQQFQNNNDLKFGTIDTFLIYKLTSGKVFATDTTNASRTMLVDLHNPFEYDTELLDFWGVQQNTLPNILNCIDNFGTETVTGQNFPILSVIGDQQSSLVGQGCTENKTAKMTFGTGGFLLINTGNKICEENNTTLNTVGYSINGKTTYAIEGSIFNCGSALNYFRNSLTAFEDYRKLDHICATANTDNLCVLPTFTGIGAPYWNGDARASITGLTLNTTKPQLTKALIESFAFLLQEILDDLKEKNIKIKELHCDGGVSKTDYLLQLIASTANLTVTRTRESESTAIGTIHLGLVASGIAKDLNELSANVSASKVFTPNKEMNAYAKKTYANWHNQLQILVKNADI